MITVSLCLLVTFQSVHFLLELGYGSLGFGGAVLSLLKGVHNKSINVTIGFFLLFLGEIGLRVIKITLTHSFTLDQ